MNENILFTELDNLDCTSVSGGLSIPENIKRMLLQPITTQPVILPGYEPIDISEQIKETFKELIPELYIQI
ncbi:hypothetical protein [Mastigocoleus sp. MO_188.B34]|uniref:hypothetical protein n=1 Tax=Mastigocoleus sp. MO_188.B34 TaxID=3036635 RepID=UPI002637E166|nr:hypothetical protein [Mastigocoleus sp. MO_188.B34]MDJ0695475.1 hypothetical protein [Mastigocoleus sp. MO_188.B34]